MPGSSDRRAMSRGLALLFGAGGTLVVVTLLLPHRGNEAQLALLVPAGLAYVVAVLLLLAPERLAPRALSAVLACGTVLVGLCVVFSGRAGAAYGFMFVWVALYAAGFLSTRGTLAHLAWLAVVYAAALAVDGDLRPPAAHWLMAVGTCAVAATLIHQLSRELRGRANDLAQVTLLANQLGGASEIDTPAIAAAICDGVMASARASAALLFEVAPEGGLEVVGRAGGPEGFATIQDPAGASRIAEALRSMRCERIGAEGGRAAGLVEPVVREGRVTGLLAVAWTRPRRITARISASLPLFAAEAGVALARAADQSRDRERRALELNDEIVQGLVVARYAISEDQMDVARETVSETLERARTLVDQQLESLHGGRAPEPGTLRREGRGIG